MSWHSLGPTQGSEGWLTSVLWWNDVGLKKVHGWVCVYSPHPASSVTWNVSVCVLWAVESVSFYLSYLGLSKAEAIGQLLALSTHNVVVLLKSTLQPQQLWGGEGRADALGLAREWSMQQQVFRAAVLTWTREHERCTGWETSCKLVKYPPLCIFCRTYIIYKEKRRYSSITW